MGVPATDRGECQLRVRVLAQQQSQPPGIGGEADRRGRAVVGTGVHALGFVTGHAAAHLAAAFAGGLVGSGQLDVFGVELFQCRLHPGVVDGLGFKRPRPQAQCRHRGRTGKDARRRRAHADRSGRRCRAGQHAQQAVHPTVLGVLVAWRAAFQIVLRVEVRSRVVGRTAGMDESHRALVPPRFETRQRGMQTEAAVELENAVIDARHRQRNRAARLRVGGFRAGDDNTESIDRAAQHDHDEFAPHRSVNAGSMAAGPGPARHRAGLLYEMSTLHAGPSGA